MPKNNQEQLRQMRLQLRAAHIEALAERLHAEYRKATAATTEKVTAEWEEVTVTSKEKYRLMAAGLIDNPPRELCREERARDSQAP